MYSFTVSFEHAGAAYTVSVVQGGVCVITTRRDPDLRGLRRRRESRYYERVRYAYFQTTEMIINVSDWEEGILDIVFAAASEERMIWEGAIR